VSAALGIALALLIATGIALCLVVLVTWLRHGGHL
jgi:hypothetical protein